MITYSISKIYIAIVTKTEDHDFTGFALLLGMIADCYIFYILAEAFHHA